MMLLISPARAAADDAGIDAMMLPLPRAPLRAAMLQRQRADAAAVDMLLPMMPLMPRADDADAR